MRDAFIIDTGFNFPIMNLANTRLMGVYGFYVPIVIYLDTLFSKKRPRYHHSGPEYPQHIDLNDYYVAHKGPAYLVGSPSEDHYANREDTGEKSSYTSYQHLPELHRKRRDAQQQDDKEQKKGANRQSAPPKNKLELGKTGSITDDQASVYGEITRAMSMTGIDGTSCLQYVICEMSQRQFADDFDTVETPVWGNTTVVGGTTSGTGDWADEEANEGSNDKADLRKGGKKAPADGFSKKKRSKRSLVTDLLTALLVPKAGQPLARFVEAAAPAPLSCAARFPACPAPLALLVRRIAEL